MLSLHLQWMYQDQEKWTCRTLILHQEQGPPLMRSVRSTPRFSLRGTRILVGHNWLQWTSIWETAPLVSSRPYTLALKHHRWVQEEIETLERAGVITKSMSPWASPIVIVPKKSQPGEPPKKRLCINFRKINDLQQKVITKGKSKGCLSLIPLPKIDEMYAKLKGAKFFLTINLRSGYYHIALGKDSRDKTAFVMPFGKYEFLQIPFGLAQAPAFFQHLMNKVLDNCPFAMMYLDDIIIFSNTEEEHLAHIEEIFKRLETADLKMKRSKCNFFKKLIHYLGHLISANGIRPLKISWI